MDDYDAAGSHEVQHSAGGTGAGGDAPSGGHSGRPGDKSAPIDAGIGRLLRHRSVVSDLQFAADVRQAIQAVELECADEETAAADAGCDLDEVDDYMMEAGTYRVWS